MDSISPIKIKTQLDEYVIGQEKAKRLLSVAAFNHYRRVDYNANNGKLLEKSNVLLIGNTGTGKTLLAKTLAKCLNVPYYIQDCTRLTANGYVGCDVEECLLGLLRSCNFNIERAQRGIIVLDEVDKICQKTGGLPYHQIDVSGEAVQQALLKIIEGDVVDVPPYGGSKHPESRMIRIDTSSILFIAMGAFPGLRTTINRDTSAGISSLVLFKYGFLPEFIGRFPVLVELHPLTIGELVRIQTEPHNAILNQYKELFAAEGIDIVFESDALLEIARLAAIQETGARGLRTIVETVLCDFMFDLFGENTCHKLEITRGIVQEKTGNSKN